mgnify:FL=1
MKKLLFIILFQVILFGNYEYSLEDYNNTSSSYGADVWLPYYPNHITLHYFSSQGWAGWTNTFRQLSDFQYEIWDTYDYENVIIIAVGQTNIENFNSNFCEDSDLPLVMDQYPFLPIRSQFAPYSDHKEIAILGYNNEIIGNLTLNNGLNNSSKNYILDILEEHYNQVMLGDINGDNILNILDIVILVDLILTNIYNEIGDINSDGSLNIQDILLLLNSIT